MSASSSNITNASIGADAGYPNLNVAAIPKNIQDGNSQAKQAYAEGLSFESVLVNELSQQMASTMYGGQGADGGSGSGSSAGATGDSSSSGMLSGAASAYSSLIPQTLTSSIMDSGGLGLAEQFAQELDPSLAEAAGASSAGGASSAVGASSAAGASSATSADGQGAA